MSENAQMVEENPKIDISQVEENAQNSLVNPDIAILIILVWILMKS